MAKQTDDDREIILSDDQGNEEVYRILFTFEAEEYGKSYVLLYRAADEINAEVEVQAFSYTPDENGDVTSGDLEPIETNEEWDMIQEVLNTFSADHQSEEQ